VDLTITAEPSEDGVIRLRLAGALDLVSRDQLLTAGTESLADAQSGLLLNLADVNFIDSTGIGTLIELFREAEEQRKQFAIEEPSQRVQRVLTLTGLSDTWTVPPPVSD
jgi:anti-anti-sigma factor